MTRSLLSLSLLFALLACNQNIETGNYLGQTTPDIIPQIFAPGIISIEGRFEHGLSFSPDNGEVVFGVLNKDDFSGEILYAKKDGNEWTSPTVFMPLKEESVYLPYFSPDGESLVYAQSIPDTNNGFTDIWIINKVNDTWNLPEKLEAPISSTTREANACMTMDRTIYFTSNRFGNGLADLYCSKPEEGNYLNVESLSVLSSDSDEESIFVAPDESYIIYSRYTNEGGAELFISYRNASNNWTEPVKVDSTINSKDWDRRPFVSADNKYLFFTRLQIGDAGLTESDIYWVSTQKLFKPYVYNPPHDTSLKAGSKFEMQIPADYFKDVTGKPISLELMSDINWLEFNKDSYMLSGKPTQAGNFNVEFRATDSDLNITYTSMPIEVIL